MGIVHNWSGRNSEGYPTLSALLAAHYALPNQPVPYLSFGGFSKTSGITRFTRINDPRLLRAVADPATMIWSPEERIISEANWAALETYRATAAQRLAAAPNLLPAEARHLAFYQSAFAPAGFEGLKAYADAIPPDDQLEQRERTPGNFSRSLGSTLRRQAQLTVLAFKTGVAVSADLWLGGFDTHTNNDPEQNWLLANLTDSVDYLWDYAETHGVADRLVVVIGSDFGRTNFYNSGDGNGPLADRQLRDHGEEPALDQPGGGPDRRVALRLPDRPAHAAPRRHDGTIIYPKHVHKALRRYLGIEHTAGARRFPFNNTEDFAFFS